MNKITPEEELDIIAGRYLGQSYHRLIETTGHGNSTISRVLKTDNLCQHVVSLLMKNGNLYDEVRFYKKWLAIMFIIVTLFVVIQIGLSFIF